MYSEQMGYMTEKCACLCSNSELSLIITGLSELFQARWYSQLLLTCFLREN